MLPLHVRKLVWQVGQQPRLLAQQLVFIVPFNVFRQLIKRHAQRILPQLGSDPDNA